MNEELIKDKLDTHERRLNDYAERIDKLEQSKKGRGIRKNRKFMRTD